MSRLTQDGIEDSGTCVSRDQILRDGQDNELATTRIGNLLPG